MVCLGSFRIGSWSDLQKHRHVGPSQSALSFQPYLTQSLQLERQVHRRFTPAQLCLIPSHAPKCPSPLLLQICHSPSHPRLQAAFFGKLSWNAQAKLVLFLCTGLCETLRTLCYKDIPACLKKIMGTLNVLKTIYSLKNLCMPAKEII